MDCYFYDVPVYRLTEQEYDKKKQLHIDKILRRAGIPADDSSGSTDDPGFALRECLHDSYGGIWKYNEVVGHIRLHFCGTQIRGEYFETMARRKVRTRRKIFEFKAWKLACEVDVPTSATGLEIYQLVLKYLERCREEIPRLHIDTELFLVVGSYIHWRELFEDSLAGTLRGEDYMRY